MLDFSRYQNIYLTVNQASHFYNAMFYGVKSYSGSVENWDTESDAKTAIQWYQIQEDNWKCLPRGKSTS